MAMKNRQYGMTFWGLAAVLMLIAFFALLVLKLLPPYLENYKVTAALRGVASQPVSSDSQLGKDEIRRALQRRFDVDDVTRVNLARDLRFERRHSGAVTARIAYEVKIPLFFNVSALLEFDESAEVRTH